MKTITQFPKPGCMMSMPRLESEKISKSVSICAPPAAKCGDLKSPKDGSIVKGLVRLILGDPLLSMVVKE